MQLRHLRTFLAVADELHFGRAAERLFIAQSSVSAQVAALERDLGVRLLDRSSRNVDLTDAGRVVVGRAARLLADADAVAGTARRAARGEVGALTLAFVDSAAYALLPPLLRALRDHLPDVSVRLQEVSVETDLDQLHARVDLAILRDVRDVSGMEVAPLLVERLVAAVPRTHALAERDELAVADLDGVDLVFPHGDLAPNVHNHLRQVYASAGVDPRIAHLALQYPTVLGLVAADYGVALVPEAITILTHADIAFIPVADPAATSTLSICRVDRASSVVASVADVARAVVDDLADPITVAATR